ncbi:hypothetical protein JYK18_33615 [Amycolatopsis sp. 195334CR]|nr:hypothetical protein [Amycolatopsis sp. 195334CR]
MRNAVAYEWFRARSLRSTWVLVLGAGVLQFASGWYWGLKRDLGGMDAFGASFGLVARLGAILVAAVGVGAFGLDHQHGTVVTTRLVLRAPWRIVVARALVGGGLALAGGVLMVVLSAAGVLAGGGSLGGAGTGRVVAGVLLLAVLSGLAGVALGGLLRHTALAIGVFAVWALVVETVVALVVDVSPGVLPFSGTAMWSTAGVEPGWSGPVVFAGLAVAGLVAVRVVLARRDA